MGIGLTEFQGMLVMAGCVIVAYCIVRWWL